MSEITADILEILLNQTEGETLDFKRDQYPFARATREEKRELVKDILAMANAWKTTPAYILIGIEECKGHRAKAVGVSEHLNDADIQQLLKDHTNQPLRCSYVATQVEGKDVGVIVIPADHIRPVYLVREYGGLKKDVVFVRRGSSTVEASPDEIARMGAQGFVTQSIPKIIVSFGDSRTRRDMGNTLKLVSCLLVDPPSPPPCSYSSFGTPQVNWSVFAPSFLGSMSEPSKEEMRGYAEKIALLSTVNFAAENLGSVAARDILAEIILEKHKTLEVFDVWSLPKKPMNAIERLNHISARTRLTSDVSVSDHGDFYRIVVNFGKIQPKQKIWTNGHLFIGASKPIEIALEVKVSGDNIPEPQHAQLNILFSTEKKEYRSGNYNEVEIL